MVLSKKKIPAMLASGVKSAHQDGYTQQEFSHQLEGSENMPNWDDHAIDEIGIKSREFSDCGNSSVKKNSNPSGVYKPIQEIGQPG